MATRVILLFLVCAFGVMKITVTQSCHNSGNGTSGHPIPPLPVASFKSRIRAIIVDKNMTVEAEEFVDEYSNKAAINIIQNGKTWKTILHYRTNEIFYITPNPSKNGSANVCFARRLTATSNAQLSEEHVDPDGGFPHLFSTAMILKFVNNSNQQQYLGLADFDGIQVDHWRSCSTWSQLNTSFIIDYFVTVQNWQTPSGLSQVPVQAQVYGNRTYANGTVTSYNHIYQIFSFEKYLNDSSELFETPPGLFCQNRNTTKPMPALNNHYHYQEEIVDPIAGTFKENEVWFDFDMKLVRSQGIPWNGTSFTLPNQGPFSVIHDFGTGVQYVIDKPTSMCTVDPLPTSFTFDSILNTTRHTLRIRTSAEFWYLPGSNFVFVGKRKLRHVWCDVYQSMTTAVLNRGPIVWEVYILSGIQTITNFWSIKNFTHPYPVRGLEWENGILVLEFDVHNFDVDSPRTNAYDVTPCFPGNKSINFQMALSMNDTQLMVRLQNYVENLLSYTLALAVPMSPIRVQNTRIFWNDREVFFQGTLLDKPPSIAKFQVYPQKSIHGVRSIGTTSSAEDCAKICEEYKDWKCISFNYCHEHECLLGLEETNSHEMNLTTDYNCSHYSRVLDGVFEPQPSLRDAWDRIQYAVNHNLIRLNLPIPTPDGVISVTMLNNTDPSTRVILTATAIRDQTREDNNHIPTTGTATIHNPTTGTATIHNPTTGTATIHNPTTVTESRPAGYSAGAMGGLGVGMLIAGLILGVAAVLLYGRCFRSGGSNLNASYSTKDSRR